MTNFAYKINYNMRKDFKFFKTDMPESRKADYYLGCHGGSVFLDFNRSNENLISLCRISFDGYGCCHLGPNTTPLDSGLSQEFVAEMSADRLNQEKITRLVLHLIKLNKDTIWNDALEKYHLKAL
jgi:hypothetical protein